jgi:hypothetical protein
VIWSTLDDEPFFGLFDAPVRSLPYELPTDTDLAAHRHTAPLAARIATGTSTRSRREGERFAGSRRQR